MPPFSTLYGYPLPHIMEWQDLDIKAQGLKEWMQDQQEMNRIIWEHLMEAQNQAKQFANARRTGRSFEVQDWILLKLQPQRQSSM